MAKFTNIPHSANVTRSADMDYRYVHFAVMAIESGAQKMNISGKQMHDRLQKQDLIHRRLFGRYEELHSQSLQYVTDDIVETLQNWEAAQ
ncbi:MAG: DUF3791 domain-containing protein [Paludibacteraceae bacterium]|nr:DUF3791 domain-containing protein [Paludibacteraceae bacterium]